MGGDPSKKCAERDKLRSREASSGWKEGISESPLVDAVTASFLIFFFHSPHSLLLSS